MYDFKTLSPIDFEDMVRDLLQEKMNIIFESFTAGRDDGIDFRYSRNFDNEIVIQCKQFSESPYKTLYRNLQEEVKKVRRLKPKRYIFATAVKLTPRRKKQIKILFHPFIHKTGDIYGANDINNLLGRFKKIEKRHFKLWLTSLEIFEKLLHGKTINFTRDSLENIRSRIKYYVQGESFSEAVKNLEKHNLCIIAGIPGIGKTTLAEMLLVHFVNSGYEAVKISEDISEANAIDHSLKKRIFYYDDFLGQTASAEKLKKNEDQRLLEFFETIKKSKLSKFILTTREHILNNAKMDYPKLDVGDFDMNIYVIDLSKYTRMIKSKILFNHIYFSDLPSAYRKNILMENRFIKIIDHPNYSPRIVGFLTQSSKIKHVKPSDYYEYFISNLKNPLAIWESAFSALISEASKKLLVVMATMPGEVFLEDVAKAFNKFNKQQADEYGFGIKPSDFKKSLKELDGNFLAIEKIEDKTILKFQNPSVRDFIQNYLIENEQELVDVYKSSIFVDQLSWIFSFKEKEQKKTKFIKLILKDKKFLINKVKELMVYEDCRLLNYRSSDGKLVKGYYRSSFEDRTRFVIHINSIVKIDELKVLIKENIWKVRERFTENTVGYFDLYMLLRSINQYGEIEESLLEIFLEESKLYLLKNVDDVDDFERLRNLTEMFPLFLKQNEKDDVVTNFVNTASESINGTISSNASPDEVRNESYKIKAVAEGFGVDLNKELDRLEDHATKLESEAEARANPDDEGWRDLETECSDDEISSLFGQLEE